MKLPRVAANPPEPENSSMDFNTHAKSIVDQAIGEKPVKKPNLIAKARGKARREALSPEKRKEIAVKAANKRWEK